MNKDKKDLEIYQAKPYDTRKKLAIDWMSHDLEDTLQGFAEAEQAEIRLALGNYVLGYLGLSYGLHS